MHKRCSSTGAIRGHKPHSSPILRRQRRREGGKIRLMSALEFWKRLPATVKASLRQARIRSISGLILRQPLRYENWGEPTPISQLRSGETALIEGTIVDASMQPRGGGRRQMLAQIEDKDGGMIAARFFNVTPGMSQALAVGRTIRFLGSVRMGRRGWEMAHPKMQFSGGEGEVQAVYSAIDGIPQQRQRALVKQALDAAAWEETVPAKFLDFQGGELIAQQALDLLHRPPSTEEAARLQDGRHPAWRRLSFDELLAHRIMLRARRRRLERRRAPDMSPPPDWDRALRDAFPFQLTAAQEKAAAEVCKDMAGPSPMRRLLQGDVGSGKTAVAAMACMYAAKSGKFAVLMAPTEILARQHYETLSAYFASSKMQCELITAAHRGSRRRDALARLRLGLSHVAVGTHALLHEEKDLPPIALAVIDEQHRFGVEQRQVLLGSGAAHKLMMSATPIPHTLMMSFLSDMVVSVLDELPPGRLPVKTIVVSRSRREEVLRRLQGKNAYWVCPRVEESESDDLQDVHSLMEEVRRDHPDLSPALLHGRMAAAEKLAAVDRFRSGEARLLVATTVIEVGVDVPQADVMVVEHAERMGLSQLHQLRGRVGRGGRPGYCMLMYDPPLSDDAKERLRIMHDETDGFKIAEKDLAMRGPGEWLGTRQSGRGILRIARQAIDSKLAAKAAKAAEWMLDNDRAACARHVWRWIR